MPPKIPAHVFGYTLATIPGVMYAIYYKRNHQSDEEFEDMLRKNYANNIEGSRAKRQEMATFLQGIKDPNSNADTEAKMAEVLKGGRGESKRHYAVDESLYGTEEGVRLRHEAEEEQKSQSRKKDARNRGSTSSKTKDWKEELDEVSKGGGGKVSKKKTKRKAKSKGSGDDSADSVKVTSSVDTKQLALITVVGAFAAGIGFLLGGKKSQ